MNNNHLGSPTRRHILYVVWVSKSISRISLPHHIHVFCTIQNRYNFFEICQKSWYGGSQLILKKDSATQKNIKNEWSGLWVWTLFSLCTCVIYNNNFCKILATHIRLECWKYEIWDPSYMLTQNFITVCYGMRKIY